MTHSEFHPNHRCQHCGERYEKHAGPNNPLAPAERCPGERWPAFPDHAEDPHALFDQQIANFWQERLTLFKPR